MEDTLGVSQIGSTVNVMVVLILIIMEDTL